MAVAGSGPLLVQFPEVRMDPLHGLQQSLEDGLALKGPLRRMGLRLRVPRWGQTCAVTEVWTFVKGLQSMSTFLGCPLVAC